MDNFFQSHPLLQGMDSDKLNFLMNFASKEKPQNMKDAMPFLIANMNLAKKHNITFTKPEIQLLVDILSKDLSSDEQEKIKRIMSMLGQ